jgi:diguanylate cyclase (GGDEF)-like protein
MPDHAFQVSTLTVAPRTSLDAGSVPAAGLPKCESLGPIVDRQLAACRRNGTSLALIVVSLDGLDAIEPHYRHAVENQVLYAAWNRLKSRLRATDLPVRVGPSEFAAVLLEVAEQTTPIIDARLIDALSQPYGIGPLEIVMSARSGSAVYPQAGTTGDVLASAAREAMVTKATRHPST